MTASEKALQIIVNLLLEFGLLDIWVQSNLDW